MSWLPRLFSSAAESANPSTPRIDTLRGRIARLQPGGPPVRHLLAWGEIDAPTEGTWVFLSSWSQAHFGPAGISVEAAAYGGLLENFGPSASDRLWRAGTRASVSFTVPIAPALLDAIERDRTEGVALSIGCRLVLAPVLDRRGTSSTLGVPREFQVLDSNGSPPGRVIALSDWVGYLRQWQWREIELFELPFDVGRESPSFRRAFDLLRTAEERLRNGDFGGTFQNCRQALESLAVDVGPPGDLKAGFSRLLAARLGEGERGKRVGALLMALNDLGHLGRHEQRPHEDLTRADAVFVLRSTLSAVQYLAGR